MILSFLIHSKASLNLKLIKQRQQKKFTPSFWSSHIRLQIISILLRLCSDSASPIQPLPELSQHQRSVMHGLQISTRHLDIHGRINQNTCLHTTSESFLKTETTQAHLQDHSGVLRHHGDDPGPSLHSSERLVVLTSV